MKDNAFEPDGWDCRLRVGLLVPDADIGPESEWSALAPAGMLVNVSRFHFPITPVIADGDVITMDSVDFVANPGSIETAIKLLAPIPVEVFSLAFTSNSYVSDDEVLVERLSPLVGGRPVVTTGQAFLAAAEHFNAKRVLFMDPPWFPPQLTAMGHKWLESKGVNVAHSETCSLPSGQRNMQPNLVHRWLCDTIKSRKTDKIDLVILGGNGFRTASTIRAVEEDTGVPVVTANTALMWQTLKAAGRPTNQITRYGQLFA
jgi:maleate isomerase